MATDFGKRLSTARKKAGLTQVQLADVVGVSQGTISELEKIGHGSAYTFQFATACNVDPYWLATGEEGAAKTTEKAPTQTQPSALAMELAWLFDDIVQGMGPRGRSIVYQAAQEAITRPIPPLVAQPSGTPVPTANPGKQRA